ncbi:hypothetical protein Tco_0833540 [Tanacetum coccineum]
MVPIAVLMKTGLRALNTTRPVNTSHPKTIVYSARRMSHFSKLTQSTVKRPYQIRTALTNKNFKQKVNTAKGKFYTARPKAVNIARPNLAVVNAVRANQGHPQKENQGYVDSGCSRYMIGNMSYLSDFKEFDGGYVTFGGGVKGGKITASTPMETLKPLMKDEHAEDVDVYLYKSMIGSLMYLTSSRPDIMFAVCACARFQVTPKVSHFYAVKRIFRYLKVTSWVYKFRQANPNKQEVSFLGGSRLDLWQCKTSKPIVALLYTEAIYMAAARLYDKADGSSNNYKIFSEMLDDFNRQDILDLHRLVKASWRLFDSCGIHILLMDNGIAIHMMIEKKYPLTQEMLSKMLSRKLEVDHENEMAFELLREITSLGEDCWELNVYILSTVNTELPILKKGEYTLWSMRMEQYLTNTDYGLWQVIMNGDEPVQTVRSIGE